MKENNIQVNPPNWGFLVILKFIITICISTASMRSNWRREYDTPLFIVSAPRIRHNIAHLLEAKKYHPRIKLCYASKANNNLGVLRVVKDAGIDVEVNSGGELFKALRAGFRPDQIEMNGISKTEQEITEAVQAGIYTINLDSPFELELVEKVAAKLKKRANVTVRLVAGVGTRSHAALQTALYTSKFGVSPEQAREMMLRALKSPDLINLAGLHIHVGSQTPDPEPSSRPSSRCGSIFCGCIRRPAINCSTSTSVEESRSTICAIRRTPPRSARTNARCSEQS
ncbi:MAG: alanine racemase [Acidobacteria bacterium]|nr:alanine racemase [Acidobacteriota bacterium]